jgi:hypothetical protein
MDDSQKEKIRVVVLARYLRGYSYHFHEKYLETTPSEDLAKTLGSSYDEIDFAVEGWQNRVGDPHNLVRNYVCGVRDAHFPEYKIPPADVVIGIETPLEMLQPFPGFDMKNLYSFGEAGCALAEEKGIARMFLPDYSIPAIRMFLDQKFY